MARWWVSAIHDLDRSALSGDRSIVTPEPTTEPNPIASTLARRTPNGREVGRRDLDLDHLDTVMSSWSSIGDHSHDHVVVIDQ